MPVLPGGGGGAANDNHPIRTGDRMGLRLPLAASSGDDRPAETVAWIEDVRCGPIDLCPAPDPRLMATGPD